MKLGVLFSGGKDSCYALWKASQKEKVVCLITIVSENKESYMFHTPNIHMTELQAQAIGLPIISMKTQGEKEKELDDLKNAIGVAKELYHIEGVVTGAVESVYQATRIQRICFDLGLWCFNPVWQKDQVELLYELHESGFHMIIGGVFAYPFTEEWLGRIIDDKTITELKELQKKIRINPAGEGGEIETLVLDGPVFRKKIVVKKAEKNFDNYAGVYEVKEAEVTGK
ncbi:TIGR00289 family protein [Candidatus Woesearchaeota archaeon]|nr:TIGR00289 family protein [Candidatus Woesearchaeota archaeon]